MRDFFLLVLAIIFVGCKNEKPIQQARLAVGGSPNIIFIVSDDLGYGSIGAYGGTSFKTPHLDYWANEGMRLTNFYVTKPVCSPSRASILTGRSPQDAGVERVLRPADGPAVKGMKTTLPTFADLIKEQGYQTALIGKWHLGYRQEEHPLSRGFDYFKGFLGGAINYLSHEYTIGGHAFTENFQLWETPKGKHATELFTEEAISFIQQERERPYLLMLSYANPHRPFLFPGEDNIQEKNPGKRLNTAKRYKEMVNLLDKQLGRIESCLVKLQQNTIIIFISDHGANSTLQANGSLKGGKGDLYEGGIKVPAIIYWPGRIEPTEITDVTTVYDLYPTLLQLSGQTIPDTLGISGHAFLNENGGFQSPVQQPLYWEHNTVKVVRNGKWKALFISSRLQPVLDRYLTKEEQLKLTPFSELYDGYIPLLYNLIDDPNEKENLSIIKQQTVTDLWNLMFAELDKKNN